jgi:hypothetical protein
MQEFDPGILESLNHFGHGCFGDFQFTHPFKPLPLLMTNPLVVLVPFGAILATFWQPYLLAC